MMTAITSDNRYNSVLGVVCKAQSPTQSRNHGGHRNESTVIYIVKVITVSYW